MGLGFSARRSEEEQLSAIATSGHVLTPRNITGSHQITGPTGWMVCLGRGVREAVSFLARARDDGRKGRGEVLRRAVEVEIHKTGWNPGFDGTPFSPSFSRRMALVMRTGSIIGLILDRGRSGLAPLQLSGQVR